MKTYQVRKDSFWLLFSILFITILIGVECKITLNNISNITFFISLFFISTLGYIFCENKFLFMSCFIMFLICGFREPIYVDDRRYLEIFTLINTNSSNIFLLQNEKGFLILNYIISILTDEYKFAQIIFIAITFIFILQGIKNIQDIVHPYFVLVYYFFAVFFRVSATGLIRIQIAVSIFIYAVSFLKKGNMKPFVICIFIASLFHRSALMGIILLLPVFKDKYFTKSKNNTIIMIVMSALGVLLLDPFISFISAIFGGKYSGYEHIGNFSLSILSFFYFFTFIYFLLIRINYIWNDQMFYDIFLYTFFIAIIIDVFFTGTTSFGRINYYLLLSFPILSGFTWKNIENSFVKVSCLAIFSFFIVVYFWGGQLGDNYIIYFLENYENMLLA